MANVTAATQKYFYRNLYAGWYQNIKLLKRGNDQQEGIVTTYVLFQCLGEGVFHTGEAIQKSMAHADRRRWIIPASELKRVGVDHRSINALDRIVDSNNRYWTPQSYETINIALGADYVHIDCVRVDPPNNNLSPEVK